MVLEGGIQQFEDVAENKIHFREDCRTQIIVSHDIYKKIRLSRVFQCTRVIYCSQNKRDPKVTQGENQCNDDRRNIEDTSTDTRCPGYRDGPKV